MRYSLWIMGFSVGIGFGVNLLIFFMARLDARRRAVIQTQLVQANRQKLNQEGHWLPVCYSSAAFFNTFWKVMGYEATGILFITNKQMTFFYPDLFKTSQALQFKPGEAKLTWLGSKVWPNGLVKWLVVEHEGKKHYFMVDAGFSTIFAQRRKTQEVYNQLSPLFT
jgi:hypothetical protein